MQDERIREVWRVASEQAKRSAVQPAFYRGIEKLVPLAWEGDVFVVGMDPAADGSLHVAVNSSENQLKIEASLRAVSGVATLKMRVVEGTALSDWEAAKARDAAVAAQTARQMERRQVSQTAPSANWDTVYDQINKLWTSNELRSTALGKGRFVVAALDLLEKAEAELGTGDEATARAVGKVLDRIAGILGGDAAWIAAMYVDRSQRGQR
jgi:hypothetical protein